MMLLSSHLTDKSKNWDTSWARKYLKIPQDQLKQLESIPGWSLNKCPTTEVAINKEAPVLSQKRPSPQSIAPAEKSSNTTEEANFSCPKGTEKLKKTSKHPMDSDFEISYSQPEMGSYKSTQIKIKPIEKLGEQVLGHKYLKGSNPTSRKSENEVPRVSQTIVSTVAAVPVEGTSKDPQLFVEQVKATEAPCNVESSRITEKEKSNILNSDESEIIVSNEAGKIIVEQDHSDKPAVDLNGENSKICTPVSVVEDSFRCDSIPCGQPVNVDVSLSPSPRDLSVGEAKSVQEVITEKIPAAAVLSMPEEVKSLHSSPHTSIGSSSTKRKRKSKGETPKEAKRSKNLKIRFTSDQVKSMLDFLKLSLSS